jgi:hypothetical protein
MICTSEAEVANHENNVHFIQNTPSFDVPETPLSQATTESSSVSPFRTTRLTIFEALAIVAVVKLSLLISSWVTKTAIFVGNAFYTILSLRNINNPFTSLPLLLLCSKPQTIMSTFSKTIFLFQMLRPLLRTCGGTLVKKIKHQTLYHADIYLQTF